MRAVRDFIGCVTIMLVTMFMVIPTIVGVDWSYADDNKVNVETVKHFCYMSYMNGYKSYPVYDKNKAAEEWASKSVSQGIPESMKETGIMMWHSGYAGAAIGNKSMEFTTEDAFVNWLKSNNLDIDTIAKGIGK